MRSRRAAAGRGRAGSPHRHPVTISLGLSVDSGDDVAYDALFKAADQALYGAKRAGRNRVVAASLAAIEPPAEAIVVGEPLAPSLAL